MAIIALFPGQGSQSVGMLGDLTDRCPEVLDTFKESSESLGFDLWALAQNGPTELLARTEITQPLILTAGVALYRAWMASGGISPSYMAGHSLGEYTALTAAGSIRLADAVKLVRARGKFMQEAVPEGHGAMAAVIGLTKDVVEPICVEIAENTGQVIEAVNFNAPGQLVIAGHSEAIKASIPKLKQAGAKRAVPLSVSAPFHCALMKPAAERLAIFLSKISIVAPSFPVIQNVSLEPETDVSQIRKQLVSQTFSPVRWSETIQRLTSLGVEVALEFGPGSVLCGLAKRIETEIPHYPLGNLGQFNAAVSKMEEFYD